MKVHNYSHGLGHGWSRVKNNAKYGFNSGAVATQYGIVEILTQEDFTSLEYAANGRMHVKTFDKRYTLRGVVTKAKRFAKEIHEAQSSTKDDALKVQAEEVDRLLDANPDYAGCHLKGSERLKKTKAALGVQGEEIERLRNLLEDVVNELSLFESAIEKHGPLGTPPAELVRLVLDEQMAKIGMLKNGLMLYEAQKDTLKVQGEEIAKLKEDDEANAHIMARQHVRINALVEATEGRGHYNIAAILRGEK